jgi:hypothetical protein
MAIYRVELMTGHALVGDWFFLESDDDEAAVIEVGRIDHPYDIHVWEGERLVGTFKASGTAILSRR